MISSLKWIKRGIPRHVPLRYEMAGSDDSATDDTWQPKAGKPEDLTDDEIVSRYSLKDYDDSRGNSIGKIFSEIHKLDSEDSMSEEELDDLTLRPTDCLIAGLRSSDDGMSWLEVRVYEEDVGNIYVHHDIMLGTDSLCMEPVHFSGWDHGRNMAAIGTLESEIEIWDLDVLDPVCPIATLKDGPVSKQTHSDAVLALSWNSEHQHTVSSGSADSMIKVWHLEHIEKAASSYPVHNDKVQSIQWSRFNPFVLGSTGYDKKVSVLDTRTRNDAQQFSLHGIGETLKWSPFRDSWIMVTDDGGMVYHMDLRASQHPMKTFQAHSEPACIDFSPFASSLILTGSVDRSLKLWDIQSDYSLVHSWNPKVGRVFSACFSVDVPFLVAASGTEDDVEVWDARRVENVAGLINSQLDQS